MSLLARRIRESAVEDLPVQREALAITTIVCDDHPAFPRGLAKLLEGGVDDIEVVGVAFSGEDAERLVTEALPEVFLLDVRMPGIGGIEAARRISAASPAPRP